MVLPALVALPILCFAALAQSAPVDVVSPHRFQVQVDGFDLEVPIEFSHPLDVANTAIERVIIVIHGSLRNSNDHYARVQAVSIAAGEAGRTLVIAPQFLVETDIDFWLLPAETLFWSSRWKQGNKSQETATSPRPARISSFAVVDAIVDAVADPAIFPNLERVVVAGHSSGGQFTHRYAGGSPAEDEHPALSFRYVVSNVSSYLYLFPERWVAGSPGSFVLPSAQQILDCQNYNEYKYGLDDPNSYIEDAGSAAITQRYGAREVQYVIGELDTDTYRGEFAKQRSRPLIASSAQPSTTTISNSSSDPESRSTRSCASSLALATAPKRSTLPTSGGTRSSARRHRRCHPCTR